MSARERILDTFESILNTDGERAATLDAVAAKAGVSKGGLLYHYPNREAQITGLLERLERLVDADVAAMAVAPEGASAYYVSTSFVVGSPLDSALIATTRLGLVHAGAVRTLRGIQGRWLALIRAEVGDDAVARAIMLIGDGLYFNAVFGGEGLDSPAGTVDDLLVVVADLIAGVRASS